MIAKFYVSLFFCVTFESYVENVALHWQVQITTSNRWICSQFFLIIFKLDNFDHQLTCYFFCNSVVESTNFVKVLIYCVVDCISSLNICFCCGLIVFVPIPITIFSMVIIFFFQNNEFLNRISLTKRNRSQIDWRN